MGNKIYDFNGDWPTKKEIKQRTYFYLKAKYGNFGKYDSLSKGVLLKQLDQFKQEKAERECYLNMLTSLIKGENTSQISDREIFSRIYINKAYLESLDRDIKYIEDLINDDENILN